jgi:hypothetical protein
MALGELGSLRDAREVVAASFEPTIYEPIDAEQWDDARTRFAALTHGVSTREGIGA